jgi:EAL domain-containing protein (putative c-di-GMP-specific phosphodiesterase class I)
MSDFLSPTQTDFLPPRFQMHPNRRAEAARRRRLLRDLDAAVSQGALRLQLWPRYAIAGGALAALEASWRWSHRRHGALPSAALAEMAGAGEHGRRLAAWCLTNAIDAAAHLAAPISVRVGPGSLPVAQLQLQVETALAAAQIMPDAIELRFAEAQLAALCNDDVLRLSALRDIGVGVALEHFGNGTSSLGLLRRIPLSAVTLSADLIRHVPHDQDDCAVLRAIVAAAQGLGLTTVACGVERTEQLDFLTKIGCAAAQGAMFRPS